MCRQLEYAIHELLKTEQEYVRDLDIIIELFLAPLVVSNILPDESVKVLFSNIQSLRQVNARLLKVGYDKQVS